MRGVRRQHLRRIPANELQLLACPGGAPRVCGHVHANICTGYLLMSFNCWRGPAVLQVFAGMPAPTRSCPSLRKECLPYTKDNPREKSEEPQKKESDLHRIPLSLSTIYSFIILRPLHPQCCPHAVRQRRFLSSCPDTFFQSCPGTFSPTLWPEDRTPPCPSRYLSDS